MRSIHTKTNCLAGTKEPEYSDSFLSTKIQAMQKRNVNSSSSSSSAAAAWDDSAGMGEDDHLVPKSKLRRYTEERRRKAQQESATFGLLVKSKFETVCVRVFAGECTSECEV